MLTYLIERVIVFLDWLTPKPVYVTDEESLDMETETHVEPEDEFTDRLLGRHYSHVEDDDTEM